MKTYYVDFSGYCEIEVPDDATMADIEEKFWEYIQNDKPLPQNIYDIEGVEEKTE